MGGSLRSGRRRSAIQPGQWWICADAAAPFGGQAAVQHLNPVAVLQRWFAKWPGWSGMSCGAKLSGLPQITRSTVPTLTAFSALSGKVPVGPVSAAPFGSASILPIPFVYISLMGASGLRRATEVAILSANYIARRLLGHYPVLYSGRNGRVAHECILDMHDIKEASGISAEDIAKRLMDYGFHAPTMSFPVAGTLMVEPTESEGLAELDRFIDAMIAIRQEIAQIERGERDRSDNVLKNAPHTAQMLLAEEWHHDYPRQQAAYPVASLRDNKYWPAVGRVDNAWGDRNLVCACLPIEAYA